MTCWRPPERGATSAEYALIASFIVIVVLTSMAFFGTRLTTLLTNDCESVAQTQASSCSGP